MHVQDHRWFEDAGHCSNARSPHHYLPGQAQQWRNASRVPRTARGSHESMGCCFLRHPGETIHGRWERGMVIHIQLHVLRGARQQDVERHAAGGRQCSFQSSPRRPAHAAAAPRSLAVPYVVPGVGARALAVASALDAKGRRVTCDTPALG